jgi:hypothetical protein
MHVSLGCTFQENLYYEKNDTVKIVSFNLRTKNNSAENISHNMSFLGGKKVV